MRPVFGQPRTMNYPFVIEIYGMDATIYALPRSLKPSNDMRANEVQPRYFDAICEELCGPYGRVMP